MQMKDLNRLASTKCGKGSFIVMGVGLLFLIVGIACAVAGVDEDDDGEGLFVVGTAIGISFGVFCLITGALICLCQDCCCFCMQPYPEVQHVPSDQGYSQQQFANGVQPIQQPLHQQLYPPQPYLTSQAPPPFSLTQQQGWPLNTNEQYTHPAKRVTTFGDLTRPMGINSLKEDSIVQQTRTVPQGYINPVFPEPQGRFYSQQATAPSAPSLDMNPPPYEP